MRIDTLPLEPSSTYSAAGSMKLPGGASVSSDHIRITTDASGAVAAIEDGTPTSGPQDARLWDFHRIRNLGTGTTWDLRLHGAALTGSVETARQALAEGADVKLRLKQGATALHWAAAKGREELARLLADSGAEVDAEDELGWRPISLAARGGFSGIVTLLQQRGARPPSPPGPAREGAGPGPELLKELERAAREGRLVISGSSSEHFSRIVPLMDAVGATRRGSQQVQGSDGRRYIVDVYVLPGGATVKAGYAG